MEHWCEDGKKLEHWCEDGKKLEGWEIKHQVIKLSSKVVWIEKIECGGST